MTNDPPMPKGKTEERFSVFPFIIGGAFVFAPSWGSWVVTGVKGEWCPLTRGPRPRPLPQGRGVPRSSPCAVREGEPPPPLPGERSPNDPKGRRRVRGRVTLSPPPPISTPSTAGGLSSFSHPARLC